MDLNFTPAELAFRDEVRQFLRDQLPQDIAERVKNGLALRAQDYTRWQKILYQRGWGAPGWPKQFGGPGWGPVEMHIFDEEAAAAGAPRTIPFGLKMVAPVIMAFGSPAQQQRFLPGIISGDVWWCQGYSEPGAGSDLASLKTRAERQGDHYIVNGQKTWNTLGQYADWIFCLVRTDPNAPKQQQGISFLLIDMKTPGITVRPIITMDGAHEVNEVWFENVKVPVENRIGEENKGWTYAKFLLGHERTNIAGVGASKRELARLKNIARKETKNGRPLLEDPLFAARVAQVEMDLMALEITNLRALSAESEKRAPGPEASILKIKGTEIQQAISELMMYAVGPYALPFERASIEEGDLHSVAGPDYAAPLAANYCNVRKVTIYGGSNEIQRNIIAQMILGL
ncbi:acyl-CoA dehydrogenase family protein [Steroidobacter sp. S1-65]|uniref:Acyl-CoA dehydrogenase family protein n=1 Tax=Steroidobacter gossypii TaxID=2805490 RepID=A0ABS1WWP6_9GAMM|nr:acyl-CoA dehydrogenase family protein [Steroidobacter gossypii]MBM0105397.1 acyl-CoA dehydrogenase family protein [Steroidobacter gossypii]